MTSPVDWDEPPLFDVAFGNPREIKTKEQKRPVWSENKAELIARYLRLFVYITHHGTYMGLRVEAGTGVMWGSATS